MSRHLQRAGSSGVSLDQVAFRACLGRFVSGVTIITFRGPDGPRGITVNAFTAVSLEPPLILVCISRRARSHDLLVGQPFTVNVLKTEQELLARRFAGADCAATVTWREGGVGPRLEGVLAYLECEPWSAYDGGDHTLFLGKVVGLGYEDGDALGFFCSRFVPVARPIPSQPAPPYDPFELPYDA